MTGRLLLVFALSAQTVLWCAPKASLEQKLIEMEKQWGQALVSGDPAVVDRFEAADIVDTAPDGSVTNKTQDLEDIRSHKLTAASLDLDDVKVRIYGHSAIVTGRLTLKGGKYGTADISGQYRFTDTWVRLNGKWQAAATQLTPIQQH